MGRNLVENVYIELTKDRWAITNLNTDHTILRAYEVGAIMHSSLLLSEILDAAEANRELSVSILSRTHIEACLVGIYIMLGGNNALDAVASDTRTHDLTTANELDNWNRRLESRIRRTRKRVARIQKKNLEIAAWNFSNPGRAPIPLIEVPHIPRANFVMAGMTDELRKHLRGVVPKRLPFQQVIDRSSEIAQANGLSTESFEPIYHVYRLISGAGSHASLGLLDSYLDRTERSGFVRGSRFPQQTLATNQNLINGVYTLSLFCEWLLGKYNIDPTDFSSIRKSLEPSNDDLRGWRPAV
jgi:hypothetical protein